MYWGDLFVLIALSRPLVESDLGLSVDWSPHSAGWDGPKSFLVDPEGDRGTHREVRGGAGGCMTLSIWEGKGGRTVF